MARKKNTPTIVAIAAIIAELRRISKAHVGDGFAPTCVTWDKERSASLPASETILRQYGYKGRRSAAAWSDFIDRNTDMIVEPREHAGKRGSVSRLSLYREESDNDTGEDVDFLQAKDFLPSGLAVCWPPRVVNEHVYWLVR